MVVVRESPHAAISPHKNTAQWPPRSPFQALLSSPSGRRKWKDRRARDDARSTSPSPMKRPPSGGRQMADSEGEEQDDEDEDEEMLKLKLQAIEAKLKLKKLQRKREAGEDSLYDNSTQSSLRSLQSAQKSPRGRLYRAQANESHETIEVPLSPTKDRILQPKEQTSPARARLGLGPTLKADGVSLKRARDGTQLQRSDSQRLSRLQDHTPTLPKPTSFSERLAQSKIEAQDERDKQSRLENARSKGFARVAQELPRSFISTAMSTPLFHDSVKRPSSAHQLPSSNTPTRSPGVARSASTRIGKSSRPAVPRANGLFSSVDLTSTASQRGQKNAASSQQSTDKSTSGYDPFTELHLSKRHIPHVDIAREMADKEVYTLVHLLKEVKAPNYDPPDCERDYVVFAVLASKSQPFDQRQNNRTSDENKPQEDADKPRNKFMVLHLTDLKWEVDLFLFGTAFDQFWKLTPGTLIAILNPAIMPPKGNHHSGRFSMKLGSSEDCVMEIGVARDLGYCASVKKDGQTCGTWIDMRKTAICDFHLNMMIERERKSRMEVNTMWRSHQDRDGSLSPPGWKRGPRSISTAAGGFDKAIEKNKHKSFHPEYGRLYAIPGGGSKSAANLLDAEDSLQQLLESQEASRKRIAAAQKERDLAKRLGEMGKGVGAEYLRANTNTTGGSAGTHTPISGGDAAAAQAALFDKPSAAELGLLANKAEHQHLSPAKDRKRHFGLGALSTTNGGAEAVGWGGARKVGLLQPKDSRLGSPEKGQTMLDVERSGGRPGIVRPRSKDGSASGSLSPSKKRARFALEKGIREPGRESLGEMFTKATGDDGSDDDELDIV